MILVDSSVLIDFFRKRNKSKTLFYQLSENNYELAISVITHYEIGIGNREIHYDFWSKLLRNLHCLPFTAECSQKAVGIYKEPSNKQ